MSAVIKFCSNPSCRFSRGKFWSDPSMRFCPHCGHPLESRKNPAERKRREFVAKENMKND